MKRTVRSGKVCASAARLASSARVAAAKVLLLTRGMRISPGTGSELDDVARAVDRRVLVEHGFVDLDAEARPFRWLHAAIGADLRDVAEQVAERVELRHAGLVV